MPIPFISQMKTIVLLTRLADRGKSLAVREVPSERVSRLPLRNARNRRRLTRPPSKYGLSRVQGDNFISRANRQITGVHIFPADLNFDSGSMKYWGLIVAARWGGFMSEECGGRRVNWTIASARTPFIRTRLAAVPGLLKVLLELLHECRAVSFI